MYLDARETSADVTLIGNDQNGQILVGGTGNDTLVAGTGNDQTLYGGSGATTYQFGSSFGQDTVYNGYASTTNGAINFTSASGITDENLWFQQSGNDLVIDLLGTTDQIDVSGWFSGNAGDQVQAIHAGGLTLDTQVAQLVSAMASYGAANSGFNPQTATAMPTDSTLQGAITAAWHS
jgi:hypothetical protein